MASSRAKLLKIILLPPGLRAPLAVATLSRQLSEFKLRHYPFLSDFGRARYEPRGLPKCYGEVLRVLQKSHPKFVISS
jgi:hypothetical protein